jgi:UDP-N-acetylmuramoyl-tripeptide--D-alanyl-D-alanine ligase
MIHMTRDQLLACLPGADVVGEGFEFNGVEIDSRKDCSGRLFVAIRGENFDGHAFVAAAQQKGAVAAVVECSLPISLPQVVVGDCRKALGDIARGWRRSLELTLVAITGSNGKTTVKEMLGRILSASAPVHMTRGNLNNDIGVPLTLFGLASEHRYAVIEMGANHVGEIRHLVAIAEPDIVYVNNAQAAHVGGFGSLDKVVEAKGEMYAHSSAQALAVFNEDEAASEKWKASAAAERRMGFAMGAQAEIVGSYAQTDDGLSVTAKHKGVEAETHLAVMGVHNARNALAAMTLAVACGLELPAAAAALTGFAGVKGRQEIKPGPMQSRIIDDSYNANPDSLAAAIDVVAAMPGEPWLALGDMAELGAEAQAMHDDAVRYALDRGFRRCFALGEKSCAAVSQFGESGHCFAAHREMADFIAPRLAAHVNLLVKGSRSAGMDKVVDLLVASDQPNIQNRGRHAV